MVCFRYIIVNTLHKGDKAIIIIIIYAIKKETEKFLKYTDLATEIQCMRNVKTKMIPIIIVATGTTSKSSRHYLSNIPGKHEITELQQRAILGTDTHTSVSASVKYTTFNTGKSITCTKNCNYRIAGTLYTLETRFVSGT